jgi:glycosyltransferase involved in cell wall biosynthesis
VIHQQQCVLLERGWRAEIEFLRYAKARGIPIVHTVHNLLPHSSRSFHAETFGKLYRLCDALICHDASTAEELCAQFKVDTERVHVIPHGPLFAQPPAETPQECRRILGLPQDRQIFLALGVLAHYKGLDVLLKAFLSFLQSATAARNPLLVIAGTGPESEKANVRAQSAQLLAHRSVRADLHYIPAQQIPLYMKAADVLVYPYRTITTSGALLTGLNYCKPIVASDLAPFRPYLKPESNAKLVTPGDIDALANALRELSDPEVFRRLSSGSRCNPSMQIQWKTIAAETTAIYRSLSIKAS